MVERERERERERVCTRKVLVFSLEVGVLLGQLGIGDLESVHLLFKGVFVVAELGILSGQLVTSLLESSIFILQLSVPLGEVLDDDLTLK